MSKVRVYELAHDLGLESKDLVDFLEDLGADIKNHMSTVEDDIAEMVREHFSKEGNASPEAQESKEPQAGRAGEPARDGRSTQSPRERATAPPARGTKAPTSPRPTNRLNVPQKRQRESAGPALKVGRPARRIGERS